MRPHFLPLLLLFAACAGTAPDAGRRDDDQTSASALTAVASLGECSGALIGSRAVLTSATCAAHATTFAGTKIVRCEPTGAVATCTLAADAEDLVPMHFSEQPIATGAATTARGQAVVREVKDLAISGTSDLCAEDVGSPLVHVENGGFRIVGVVTDATCNGDFHAVALPANGRADIIRAIAKSRN